MEIRLSSQINTGRLAKPFCGDFEKQQFEDTEGQVYLKIHSGRNQLELSRQR